MMVLSAMIDHSSVPNGNAGKNIWPLASVIGSMMTAARMFMPAAVRTGPISASAGRAR